MKISGGEATQGHVHLVQGRFNEAKRVLLASYEATEAVRDRAPYRMGVLESLIELYDTRELGAH